MDTATAAATASAIESSLQGALCPHLLHIRDDSAKHAGHPQGKAHGGGHFYVQIVSPAFDGKPRLARHRLVYDAVGTIMAAGRIHALQIDAFTPQEWAARQA